jgi:hypothetical protein
MEVSLYKCLGRVGVVVVRVVVSFFDLLCSLLLRRSWSCLAPRQSVVVKTIGEQFHFFGGSFVFLRGIIWLA